MKSNCLMGERKGNVGTKSLYRNLGLLLPRWGPELGRILWCLNIDQWQWPMYLGLSWPHVEACSMDYPVLAVLQLILNDTATTHLRQIWTWDSFNVNTTKKHTDSKIEVKLDLACHLVLESRNVLRLRENEPIAKNFWKGRYKESQITMRGINT